MNEIHTLTPCQISGHRFEDGFCPDCGEREEKDITPIVSLGGKTSLGTSKVVEAELAAFNDYKSKLDSLLARHGAVNTEEAAAELRKVIAEGFPDTVKVMDALKLSR